MIGQATSTPLRLNNGEILIRLISYRSDVSAFVLLPTSEVIDNTDSTAACGCSVSS